MKLTEGENMILRCALVASLKDSISFRNTGSPDHREFWRKEINDQITLLRKLRGKRK